MTTRREALVAVGATLLNVRRSMVPVVASFTTQSATAASTEPQLCQMLALPRARREQIVETAIQLLEDHYVYLYMKRRTQAADPVPRLKRLLRTLEDSRTQDQPAGDFPREML